MCAVKRGLTVAMKNIFSEARFKPGPNVPCQSAQTLHNANSKGTTAHKSAQLLREQEQNTQLVYV